MIAELPPTETPEFQIVPYALHALRRGYNNGLRFNKFRVPKENLLVPAQGNGLTIAYHGLNHGRVAVCAGAAGAMRIMLASILPWAEFRRTYGQPIATAAEYYQSAADLAETGEQADIPSETPPANADPQTTPSNTADAQWLPLGVFEALQPDQKSSKMTFQIAVNKDGIVRGNYFNTGDKNAKPIAGAVDKKTQRITWVVQDKDKIIFDTGLYNLTKDETTVLVHFSKDKTEQWTLVRLKQPQQTDSQQ